MGKQKSIFQLKRWWTIIMQVEVMEIEMQLKTLRTLVLYGMTSIEKIEKFKFKEINSNALLVVCKSQINFCKGACRPWLLNSKSFCRFHKIPIKKKQCFNLKKCNRSKSDLRPSYRFSKKYSWLCLEHRRNRSSNINVR
jgi:hypothetical protein